jgi:hypothetical protein
MVLHASVGFDQHGARRALPFAAAIFRAREIEIFSQHAEKGAPGVRIDPPPRSVDIQFPDVGHTPIVMWGRPAAHWQPAAGWQPADFRPCLALPPKYRHDCP